MPTDYLSKSIEGSRGQPTAAELARRHDLTILVRRYEVVRTLHGPERDQAERALGLALSREDQPFCLDGLLWRWSRTEQSIMRHKAISQFKHPAR